MKLIPHHQDDKHGTREYRSPDGAGRVVQTRRPGGSRNARPRWEVHERCEGRGAGWRHHAAFERRRDALVFLDTTAASVGGRERHDSARQAARDPRTLAGTTPVQPAPDAEGADHARPRRNPLPGHPVVAVRRVLLYDPRQIAKEGEPATCGKCQRFRSAASYRKRQAAKKAAKKET